MYMDQIHENDVGLALAAEHDVPIYRSIPEALKLGGASLAVDGVLIIGEHGDYAWNDIEDLQQIDKPARDHIEHIVSQKVALEICARLPKNEEDIVSMIDKGYELAKHMSWEAVVKNYVLKSLHKAIRKKHPTYQTA